MKHFDLRRTPAHQIILVILVLWVTLAHSSATTSYTISLANPEQHLVEVQIVLPEGLAQRQLQFPVWNALYQVRD